MGFPSLVASAVFPSSLYPLFDLCRICTTKAGFITGNRLPDKNRGT